MRAAVKLVSDNPAVLSPARTKLARALEMATKAHRRVDAARTALARAREMQDAAEVERGQAAAELGKARTGRAKALAAATKHGTPPPASAVPELVARVTAAAEEVEATRMAVATCEEAIAEAEEWLRGAEASLPQAAQTVLKEAAAERVPHLLEEAQAVQEKLVTLRLELAFAVRNDLISDHDLEEAVDRFLFERDLAIPGSFGKGGGRRAQGRPDFSTRGETSQTFGTNWEADPRYQVLAAFRDQLARDHEASLPAFD